jgi:hypothetical protein
MTIRLTESQRQLLEHALDAMRDEILAGDRPMTKKAKNLYCSAVTLVRERPAETRKVRSDFGTSRPTPQLEVPGT